MQRVVDEIRPRTTGSIHMLSKLIRLSKIAAYNRDWQKYLPFLGGDSDQETQTFRLRNGQVVEVKSDARFILNEIYLDKVYDILGEGADYSQLGSVLDLGANVGLFATYVSSRNSRATTYCFEPAAVNYRILQRNIQRNTVNAKIFQLAVSVDEGLGHLSHRGSSVEYALVDGGNDNTEEVQCVAHEQVFSLCGVERFDLLKVDIEGHEKPLFNAASDDWLRRFDRMIVEWHYSWEELVALAERLRHIGFDAEPVLIEGHMRFLRAQL